MTAIGYRATVILSFLFIVSCAEGLILLHPHSKKMVPSSSVSSNFMNECAAHFVNTTNADTASSHYKRCSNLTTCLSNELRGTALDSYRSLSTFEKIKPPGSHVALPITEMQANAQKAGPKAIAMVNQISDIRTQCLVRTGLDQEYQ